MRNKILKSGLLPLVGENPKLLILGSLPGDESIKQQKYYSNPRNQFWKIINHLFTKHINETDEELLKRNRIALWDCCIAAKRVGSLDSGFVFNSEKPNNLKEFLDIYPSIKTIILNGKTKTFYLYNKFFSDIDNIKVLPLVSTSSVAGGIDKKITEWSIIKKLTDVDTQKEILSDSLNSNTQKIHSNINIEYIKELVEKNLKSRNLKSNVRFQALSKIMLFIKRKYGASIVSLPDLKSDFKRAYEEYKGSCMNGAEKSAMNELYNQITQNYFKQP